MGRVGVNVLAMLSADGAPSVRTKEPPHECRCLLTLVFFALNIAIVIFAVADLLIREVRLSLVQSSPTGKLKLSQLGSLDSNRLGRLS